MYKLEKKNRHNFWKDFKDMLLLRLVIFDIFLYNVLT